MKGNYERTIMIWLNKRLNIFSNHALWQFSFFCVQDIYCRYKSIYFLFRFIEFAFTFTSQDMLTMFLLWAVQYRHFDIAASRCFSWNTRPPILQMSRDSSVGIKTGFTASKGEIFPCFTQPAIQGFSLEGKASRSMKVTTYFQSAEVKIGGAILQLFHTPSTCGA